MTRDQIIRDAERRALTLRAVSCYLNLFRDNMPDEIASTAHTGPGAFEEAAREAADYPTDYLGTWIFDGGATRRLNLIEYGREVHLSDEAAYRAERGHEASVGLQYVEGRL